MNPDRGYDPVAYWSSLVGPDASLAAVGQHELGAYNHFAYRRRQKAFLKALSGSLVSPASSVFEAAFGNGFYLSLWKQKGVTRLVGVDLSPAAVTSAQLRFPEYELFCHDLTTPLVLREKFDVVTAIDVLYHIVDDHGWQVACHSLCSLVKPGGSLILSDKFPQNKPHQAFPHVRRRPLSWYQGVLADHHMAIKQIIPVFLLMDDPIPVGNPRWLAQLAYLQWRVVAKSIRSLGRWPLARDAVARGIAVAQTPFEVVGITLMSRTPNLELLVATSR